MGQWRQAQTGLQKFPRIAMAVPVRVSTVDAETDPSNGRTFFRSAEETTANLSRGGAYVKSWEPLAAGRRVVITIDLPDEHELQLVGRVVWTRRALQPNAAGEIEPAGYGIEFVGGSRSELEALDRYLKRVAPRAKTGSPPALGASAPTP
ncbi:MAG: PilZ domain-containing protein [Myxococcota bacterium]